VEGQTFVYFAQLERVVQAKRQRQAVEAWAEIGGAGRYCDTYCSRDALSPINQ
jgi:hypothetical protein